MRRLSRALGLVGLAGAVVASIGCATTSDIDKRIAESQTKTDKKIESVETQVETLQEKQKATDVKVEDQGKKIEVVSQSASEALKRAQEAGILAKGKVVFEQTFSEDRVRFALNKHDLSKDSKAALDEFAAKVKALNRAVWIEIQGHTDNTGDEDYNDELGQKRADAVKRYLVRGGKLPAPRISTVSYGDTSPAEPNKTSKGRAANRRVVLVVME